MKNTLLLFFMSFTTFIVRGQGKDLIRDLDSVQSILPHKSSIVCIAMPWCAGAMEEIKIMEPPINLYRNNFNLIIVVDSNYFKETYRQYYDAVKKMKPDRILTINEYYPLTFKKKKESESLAKLLKQHYPNSIGYKRVGTGSIFAFDCNRELLRVFTVFSDGLNQFEKELKELPQCN